LVSSLAGCFAVTDVDRFENDTAETVGAKPYRDLRFSLTNAPFHAQHIFGYRVTNDANVVLTSGVIEPAGEPPITVFVASAVPRGGGCRLDFYADVNGSGTYDGIGDAKDKRDHAWRIQPLDETNVAYVALDDDELVVSYPHDTNFTDIDTSPPGQTQARITGLDVAVELTGLGALGGKLLEARLLETASGRVTSLRRLTAVNPDAGGVANLLLRGAVEDGVGYALEIYVDRNGDRAFQPTGQAAGDGGWRVPFTADSSGKRIVMDLSVAAEVDDLVFVY
jgi:hypothetical protein